MKKINLALALTLVFGVISGGLTSCGKRGSADALKSGFFVADGDLSKVDYPLVVIKVGNGKSALYQVSQILSLGFGAGTSVSSDAQDSLGTLISHVGPKTAFAGIVTKAGSDIRMRSYKTQSSVSRPEDLATRAEIRQDYSMRSVTKDKAMVVLRELVAPRAAGTVYSDSQEEACRSAFDLSCTELVPAL